MQRLGLQLIASQLGYLSTLPFFPSAEARITSSP
jgi:hypothetical protein